MTQTLIGFDYETYRMGAGYLIPKVVCGSLAYQDNEGNWSTYLGISAEPESLEFVKDAITNPNYKKVAHNAAFDLAVLCGSNPELFPRVFEMLQNHEVSDTLLREKLLNLTDHGSLGFMPMPDGSTIPIEYNLAALAKFYLGKDRTDDKKSPDAWRTNYHVLDGVPREQWPEQAVGYAIEDSVDVVAIHAMQEQRRADVWRRSGFDPFAVEPMKVAVDFALFLASAWGMRVDPEYKARIEAELAEELSEDKLSLLIQQGILRPGKPSRPHKNGATNDDGTPKMTLAKKATINKGRLQSYIQQVADVHEHVEVWHTSPSDTFPNGQISTAGEWFEEYQGVDPVLDQYLHRQKLQKMVTTEMPRLCSKDAKGKSTGITSPVVHPCFNSIVETGRTSSFATDTYPSLNGQNVDPRARGCIIPRDGYVFFSVDYNQMELGTLAQRCLDLFGFSVLADTINAGIDVHEYMGAQLAFHLNEDFQTWVRQTTNCTPQEIHAAFASTKKSNPDFYKHFRKFAKPTNLGYPGGLGPSTFIAYAKGTFGLTVDLDMATRLRELWMQTFPEMELYFRYIKEQMVDHRNSPKLVKKDDGSYREIDVYAYTTRFGLHRAGATFCAAANGTGLQSPSAEGATLALFNVQRACYDWSQGSILRDDEYGPVVRVNNFIHDELMGEVREDGYESERVMEIARIMVEAMKAATPDVTPRAEAALMRRWDKRAEPVFNEAGKLIPWQPKEAA